MRILLVTGKMNSGGAETHVYELARSLCNAGHTVTLASVGGRLARELGTMGVKNIRLPLNSKSPFSLAFSVKKVKRLIKSNNYQIVHAHTRIAAAVCHLACKNKKCAFVTTVHAHFKSNFLFDKLSRWGCASIAVSEDLKDYLLTHSDRVLARNIRVIPNGIDTDKFFPLKNSSVGKRVVFASRLDADCSEVAYLLCSVAKRLLCRFEDVQIVICGGGSEHLTLKRLAQEVNAELGRKVISTLGNVENMAEILQGASVFVGVSRAALEAMCCALPVIIGGNEGYIGALDENNLAAAEQTNFCARGCERVNEEKLFASLVSILSLTQAERREQGEALRRYAAERHSVGVMREMTEEFYQNAMKRAKSGKRGVLLCGYYGYGNMGDDALLMSAVQRAHCKFPSLPVCALTAHGKRDSDKFGVRCASRSNIITLIKEIKNAETVVFGGGTLFQNTTSSRSLWYYIFILRLAQRLGKRTELWGNGIGRISGKCAKNASARAICECDYVGLRDEESIKLAYHLAKERGGELRHIRLEKDLAMCNAEYDAERAEYILRKMGISRSNKIAVVVLRGSDGRKYTERAEILVKALLNDGIVPVFAVMFAKEDMEICKTMSKRLGCAIAYPLGADALRGIMKRAEVVIGMRYHALVFAHSVGTRFIGIGSEPKIRRFCYSHNGVFWG